jgi:hypothetical protein
MSLQVRLTPEGTLHAQPSPFAVNIIFQKVHKFLDPMSGLAILDRLHKRRNDPNALRHTLL